MRITLAEIPVYRTPGIFTRNSCFDPLGIEYVAGTLLREGAEVMVMQQRGQSLDQFAGEILATEPDMVGFSAMTYNFPASTHVARLIKGRKPGVVTLFGGEHVSAVPDEVRDGCIDFVVMGEGEETASELVRVLSSGSDASGIAGLAYKQGGDVIINPRRARNKTLDSLPFPLRSPALLEGNAITHMSPPISAQRAVTQMTYSRGCPYSCSYCTAPSMWLPTVSWREPKHVIGEIKETQKRFGTNTVFFTDLTFNVNPARAEKLCDAMLDEGIRLYWYAMARTDRMTPALLEKMYAAGCRKVAYGFETPYPALQREYHKEQGNLDHFRVILEAGQSLGMINKAYLIIGHPLFETEESIAGLGTALRDLARHGLHEIRISMLTPFPGTEEFSKWANERMITTRDWSQYHCDHPTLYLAHLTPEQLHAARFTLFNDFYGSKEYLRTMKDRIRMFPEYASSFAEYAQFITTSSKGKVRIASLP